MTEAPLFGIDRPEEDGAVPLMDDDAKARRDDWLDAKDDAVERHERLRAWDAIDALTDHGHVELRGNAVVRSSLKAEHPVEPTVPHSRASNAAPPEIAMGPLIEST